ncbi:MAG: hypothetical protein H7222_16035 [Methylotenera sp.]|nr:hypothetical protein [Oligoflexia bacterium]
MTSIEQIGRVGLNFLLTAVILSPSAFAQQVTQTTPANPMSPPLVAGAAATGLAMGAVAQVLFVTLLVVVLLAGGMLILNMGLLSKRATDHTGSKDPSDLGFLHNERFPEDAYEQRVLPAWSDVDDLENSEVQAHPSASQPRRAA